jgi:tricorn protease-like protein
MLIKTLTGHSDRIKSIAFIPNRQIFASGSYDDTIRLWNMSNGEVINVLDWNAYGAILISSLDGQMIISGNGYNAITVWRVNTGEKIKNFPGRASYTVAIAFSSNGKTFANTTEDGTINLWSVETGEIIKVLSSTQENQNLFSFDIISSLAFDTNNQFIVSMSQKGLIKVWKLETNQIVKTFNIPQSRISPALSPDGCTIAVENRSNILLINAKTGQEIGSFPTGLRFITTLEFSNDGRILAGAGETIKLWTVEQGQEIQTFIGHKQGVLAVRFNFDNSILASAGADALVKFWEV